MNYLSELYQELQHPSAHLSDKTIAEMADATIWEEPMSVAYPDEMQHLEVCPDCAADYEAVVALTQQALGEMSIAAEAVPAEKLLATMLLSHLPDDFDPDVSTPNIIDTLLQQLPLYLSNIPHTEKEVKQWLQTIPSLLPAWLPTLANTIFANIASLNLYLIGKVNKIWGEPLRIQASYNEVQFMPASPTAIPTLGHKTTGDKWLILERKIGDPIPFNVVVFATRYAETDLTCQLQVQIDRIGLTDRAGRQVTIQYGDVEKVGVTDNAGIATFEQFPISTIPNLSVKMNLD